MLLRPNQSVRKGQLLAMFDSTGLRSEQRQLRQEIEALQRQARQAQEEQRCLNTQVQALEGLANSLTEASRRSVDQARASLAFEQRQLQRYASLVQAGALSSRQGRCPLKPGMRLSGDVVTRRTTVLAFLLNKLRLGQAS